MSKEDVINYVMTTPGNPNKAVLSGMLDSVAQSGGTVEVSKIKIATANGGWNKVGSTKNATFGGGLTISGSQILDLIGDKTVIGVEMIGVTSSNPTRKHPIEGVVNCSNSSSATDYTHFNLALATREEIASIEGIEVYGTAYAINTEGDGGTVDIYAICI